MDELNVIFTPDDNVKFPQYRMPQLQLPLLRTSGKLKVMQLRKYLKLKLGIEAAADDKVRATCSN